MTEKRTAPLSVRISPELNERLEKCAAELRMKKHSLAQAAIESAVDAIEKNDYRLVLPIKFHVEDVPAPKHSTSFPSPREERIIAEERPVKYRRTKTG